MKAEQQVPEVWWKVTLKRFAGWLAAFVAAIVTAWLSPDFVFGALDRFAAWLGQPSALPNWIALLCSVLVVCCVCFGGVAAVARWRRERPPPYGVFRKGVFGCAMWHWTYPVDHPVPICPFDETEMELSYDGTQSTSNQYPFRCPLCFARCIFSSLRREGMANVVVAEVNTGRWREHHASIAAQQAELCHLIEALGTKPKLWVGDWTIEQLREAVGQRAPT